MQKLLPFLVLAALAAPAVARAGDVTMRVVDVPLGARTVAGAPARARFNMLGAHWRGPGSVSYRVHRLRGGWSAWRPVDADGARGIGSLDWTGAADAVRFRAHGAVWRLRAYELWSRVRAAPVRVTASAGLPAIVTRSGWDANEEIVRQRPLVAPVLKLAIVHHTAGTNVYTRAQAAAIVRGIETYHVLGNGWNDIGYNFLVDRFGTIYEGRGGGIDRNVIGAHSLGFNAATVGVALIGNYGAAAPTKAQLDALVRLLAWRLDVAHVDPRATVVYTSGGNFKYRAGRLVTLRAISGHRDTGPTECPGGRAYRLLGAVTTRVASTGLPKLYYPTVAGSLGGPVTFRTRLSSALPWTVTVTDQLGAVVARGTGRGSLVDWTWSSALAGTGRFTWTIAAAGVRPASGSLGVGRPLPPPAAALSLTGLTPAAPVIAGGDTSLSFTLGAPALVTVEVADVTGASTLTVLSEPRPAGANTVPWNADPLPDGRYRIVVTAVAGGVQARKAADLVVDRTVTGLAAVPSGAGGATLSFTLAQPVPVRLDVVQNGVVVATPFQGALPAGPQSLVWDGTAAGLPLPAGRYALVLTVTDALGDVPYAVPVDTQAS